MTQTDILKYLKNHSRSVLVLDFNGTLCTYRGNASYAALPENTYMSESLADGWHRFCTVPLQVVRFCRFAAETIGPENIYVLSTISCNDEYLSEQVVLEKAGIGDDIIPKKNYVGVSSNQMKMVWLRDLRRRMGDRDPDDVIVFIDDTPDVLMSAQTNGCKTYHASELWAIDERICSLSSLMAREQQKG